MFARHGFQDVAERINLLKPFTKQADTGDLEKQKIGDRLKSALEELGPTFIKLGQLLATRPDLITEDIAEALSQLHSSVKPLPLEEIHKVIESELTADQMEMFDSIDDNPLGAASIAQVHRARLKSGESVVIKVQRPGIVETIEKDMAVMYFIADLLEKYLSEAKLFMPAAIVEEFDKTLSLETNFIVEANNIRRFAKNFADEEDIVIPRVYWDLTTEKVLVMEYLDGTPLSEVTNDLKFDREKLVRRSLKAYFKMVFKDRFFHGDLHAGNFLIMDDNRIGLVDFGVVGRLSEKTQGTVGNMLIALSTEDYDRLAFEYLDIAPFNEETDPDRYARELADLTAPYFGLSLKNVNLGKILMSSASISTRNHVYVPAELMLFFKSVVAIEGLGRKIIKDFDFLQLAIEFAGDLVVDKYDPKKLTRHSAAMARDTAVLAAELPRQVRQLVRRTSAPNFAFRHRVEHAEDMVRAVENFSHLLFLSVVIGSLLIGSSILSSSDISPKWLGLPLLGLIGFSIAGVLSLVSVYQYLKK